MPASCRVRPAVLAAALIVAADAQAQVPAGPEFQVNTYTTERQFAPNVAIAPDGSFLVVWGSDVQDGGTRGMYARRYNAMGAAAGPEFLVNAFTTGSQFGQGVAFDAGRKAVVVWTSDSQDGSSDGGFGRRYDPSGGPIGGEFAVNSYTTGPQTPSDVTVRRDRSFIVVFDGPDGDGQGVFPGGIFARVFDQAAVPTAPDFQVNTYTTGEQLLPSVAALESGGFVVAWTNDALDWSSGDVHAQRFASNGGRLGGEFRVNSETAGRQWGPVVVSLPGGRFNIYWTSLQLPPPPLPALGEVRGQRYAPDGTPLGPEFQINGYTTGYQGWPGAAADELGNVVVSWSDYGRDGDQWGVFGQRFDDAGNPRGSDFQVNTSTYGYQQVSRVAVDSVGNFIVAWQTLHFDGSQWEAMGRRFGALRPIAAVTDAFPTSSSDGNGVLEPGESVRVVPSWRNVSDAPVSFSGQITQFTGPGGAVYSIVDGTTTYGTVPPGAGGNGEGYELRVSAPATRPSLHWDTLATEAISPDAQGQRQRWSVHVGDTFGDVPRASPFYFHVETLLHRGVTSGCAAGTYCPFASTTREQMSVFVLAAKEGAGYAPPACTTPVFNDVPASSPFCRWIEELARSGVTGGCGGGNYCPTAAVSREQMAVFVLRTLDPTLNPPACVPGAERFADVPASSGFCRWIEELARRGIVTGCGGGNYCPTTAVTREQMSVFLTGTFGLTLYGP